MSNFTFLITEDVLALEPYERACIAEDVLSAIKVETAGVDLLNVIRSVADDVEFPDGEEGEAAHRDLIANAYNHYANGTGVDYSTDVGELYYGTVRDAVSDAMRRDGFIPEEA